jgi:hypothetical protein
MALKFLDFQTGNIIDKSLNLMTDARTKYG